MNDITIFNHLGNDIRVMINALMRLKEERAARAEVEAQRPYLYFQPEDLTWLTKDDMRATWIEQAKHAADELRGILVYVDCGGKHGKWLGYDQFREEWKYAGRCGPVAGSDGCELSFDSFLVLPAGTVMSIKECPYH